MDIKKVTTFNNIKPRQTTLVDFWKYESLEDAWKNMKLEDMAWFAVRHKGFNRTLEMIIQLAELAINSSLFEYKRTKELAIKSLHATVGLLEGRLVSSEVKIIVEKLWQSAEDWDTLETWNNALCLVQQTVYYKEALIGSPDVYAANVAWMVKVALEGGATEWEVKEIIGREVTEEDFINHFEQ